MTFPPSTKTKTPNHHFCYFFLCQNSLASLLRPSRARHSGADLTVWTYTVCPAGGQRPWKGYRHEHIHVCTHVWNAYTYRCVLMCANLGNFSSPPFPRWKREKGIYNQTPFFKKLNLVNIFCHKMCLLDANVSLKMCCHPSYSRFCAF